MGARRENRSLPKHRGDSTISLQPVYEKIDPDNVHRDHRLTVNQTILLLDIFRGTVTQRLMGTLKKDIHKLAKEGLVDYMGENVTYKGARFANSLLDRIPFLLREINEDKSDA